MRRLWLVLLAPLLTAQPHLQNARLETRAVSGSMASTFSAIVNAQTGPAWVAYAAPQIPGERQMCCWNTSNNATCQGCALEPQSSNPNFPANAGPVRLEGAAEFYVFLRIENKQVDKVRSFSVDCNIDAGGLPFYWLTGPSAAESVALLESLIPAGAGRKLAHQAISAIALHRDPSADAALDRMLAPTNSEETRRQAAFWLGNARGRHGYESLLRVLRDDPSDRVREHAIFALSQAPNGDGVPMLIDVARNHRSAQIRQKAMFWLGQSKDPRAIKFFEDVLATR